jgi:cell filamentation protein
LHSSSCLCAFVVKTLVGPEMGKVRWRWEERDFGFRFRSGRGSRAAEYYQARDSESFYVVPANQRKLDRARIDELDGTTVPPTSPRVVANPWQNYEYGWDWIETEGGICLNWAGCLEKEEIDRREDEGVQRAMEMVVELVQRPEPVPLTVQLICQLHAELMGAIYPFAGEWRQVGLHKGEGPERWPLPPCGIGPLMDVMARDVFSRSPMLSDDDLEIFAYTSEVMNEILALHPFREGNGRTAFVVGNLILMQNNMLPLTTYERRRDEARYFAACDAGRVQVYGPLAELIAEWEDLALERWNQTNG